MPFYKVEIETLITLPTVSSGAVRQTIDDLNRTLAAVVRVVSFLASGGEENSALPKP